jgi:hypothetical protein
LLIAILAGDFRVEQFADGIDDLAVTIAVRSGPTACKYPPAKPGALDMWPLKAAGPDLKPHLCGSARNTFSVCHLNNHSTFSATFGEQLPRDTYIPTLGLRFQVVHRQTSFRVRGGSRSEVSAMGDRRKCQTYAASPAEPGGLPVMLVELRDRSYLCGPPNWHRPASA